VLSCRLLLLKIPALLAHAEMIAGAGDNNRSHLQAYFAFDCVLRVLMRKLSLQIWLYVALLFCYPFSSSEKHIEANVPET